MVFLLLVVFTLQVTLITYFLLPYIIEAFPQSCRKYVFRTKSGPVFNPRVYTHFESVDLPDGCAQNYYVNALDEQAMLGVWHVLPKLGQNEEMFAEKDFETIARNLPTNLPVFIYFHGNSKSRAIPWRVNIYKLLSTLGYHVISFDYRGYGDSSGSLKEEKECVLDSLTVLKFVCERYPNSPIFFWGHSLGTGVVGSLVNYMFTHKDELDQHIRLPNGILLDAPFTCLKDVVGIHFYLQLYRIMPHLYDKLVSTVDKLKVPFNTQTNLASCPIPIIIMHAEDDNIVPFYLGEKLAQTLSKYNHASVIFKRFSAEFGYEHNYIHTAPDLPDLISKFVQSTINGTFTELEQLI